jgi:hypothetical protein
MQVYVLTVSNPYDGIVKYTVYLNEASANIAKDNLTPNVSMDYNVETVEVHA